MSQRHPSDAELTPGHGETLDAILGGRVKILQRQHGYRFNLDPILLAHFAHNGSRGLKGRVIDLGTGSGIIPLLLAQKFNHRALTAVEIQPALASLAERNVRLNGCEDKVQVMQGDLRDAPTRLGRGKFQHVICNPPYGSLAHGKLNPTAERAIARHELLCSLVDVVQTAAELLHDGGSVWMIYPAQRLTDLFAALAQHSLRARRLQAVHPRAHMKARLALVQAVKRGRSSLTLCAPLVIHEGKEHRYSGAVEEMLAPPEAH